jgi:hypothetical protein
MILASECRATQRGVVPCGYPRCYEFGSKGKHVSVDPLNKKTLVPRLSTIREEDVAIISGPCHNKHRGQMPFVAGIL